MIGPGSTFHEHSRTSNGVGYDLYHRVALLARHLLICGFFSLSFQRMKAGMVRLRSASPSVDRRTVPSRASRTCRTYMRFAGACTTHRVARDCAMVAAHATATDAADAVGGETGWRLCGADEQIGRRVLWVLERCRSRRASLFPFNPFPQSTHNIPHRPATHFQKCFLPFIPYNFATLFG
jgi:hypothetical protein